MFIFTQLSDYITYHLFGLVQTSQIASAVHFFIEDITKIFVLLAILIYVIAFIRAGLPIEKLRTFLMGRNRFLGYFLAALIGAITPFCSCSSIPLFLGFTAARIPIGITMAFLITSPMINEVAVMMLGGIVGWELTAIYVIFGMTAGILGGFFFDLIRADRWLNMDLFNASTPCSCAQKVNQNNTYSFRYRHKFAMEEFLMILKRIYLWIIIGIGMGAALHGYLPDAFIQNHLASGEWWTVPLAVTIGIPTYANATGVIPVIGALIAKGLPIGTAFAFMLSTAAVSIPEFIMLKQVMKLPLLFIFAVFLLVFFTLCGWLLNFIY